MRAGIGKHLKEAEGFMREACKWHDEHYSCIKQIRMLIVLGRLNDQIMNKPRMTGRLSSDDVVALRYLMRRQDWINDMRITYESNLNSSFERMKHYELKARAEWELAEGRDRDGEH